MNLTAHLSGHRPAKACLCNLLIRILQLLASRQQPINSVFKRYIFREWSQAKKDLAMRQHNALIPFFCFLLE
jgi:hypothetical protein